LIKLPEARSNGTSFNATLSSGEKTARGHQLHIRAACSSYKSVVAGDTCATLVTKCGITAAQFTIYNPATNLCSALAVGQIVCCSSGTVPDLTPQPNADGSCSSYVVKSGEYCSAIAASNSITVAKIESMNTKTWGWMGCSSLQSGQNICSAPALLLCLRL